MTITEFLLARIAEDEAVARRLPIETPMGFRWDWYPFDPVRVLAECQAKRAIIGRLAAGQDQSLRALAAVYADHPDYQPEWRP